MQAWAIKPIGTGSTRDNNFARSKFIEKAIAKFKLPASAHEWLNDEIVRIADEQDESPAALWAPIATQLATIEPAVPHWLWDGRLPLGAISAVDGDGGLGKSQMMIDLACRGGRGEPLPQDSYAGKPWGTLIVTSEDANDFVIRPRIDAAGGDNGGIYSMSSVAIDGTNKRQVELPTDIPVLEHFIAAHSIKLLVFDPYSQFLASALNINSDADNRKALGPLAEMAERQKIAAVLIRHLTKKVGTSARHRGGGSVAILAAARAGYLLGIDPDDKDRRVLAPTKNNLAPEPSSLSFTIEQVGTTSRVRWQGETSVTASQMCHAEAAGTETKSKVEQAKGILQDVLSGGRPGRK